MADSTNTEHQSSKQLYGVSLCKMLNPIKQNLKSRYFQHIPYVLHFLNQLASNSHFTLTCQMTVVILTFVAFPADPENA